MQHDALTGSRNKHNLKLAAIHAAPSCGMMHRQVFTTTKATDTGQSSNASLFTQAIEHNPVATTGANTPLAHPPFTN